MAKGVPRSVYDIAMGFAARHLPRQYEVTFKARGDSAKHVKSAMLAALARRDNDSTEVRVPSIKVRRVR